MKRFIEAGVIGFILTSTSVGQDITKPILRKGISVQMAVADHAVETRAADDLQATVVVIMADGKLFAGIEPTEPAALASLSAGTVYVKADARAPFQKVLTVLDALRGKSVVLLSTPPANAYRTAGIAQPYGIKLVMSK